MKISSFEDLECWKEAVSLTAEIYQITLLGDIKNDFSFRDQIRRASVSIAANIAEGKERETLSEFIRFLYIAKGSAGELRTHLIIAKEIGYLNESEFQKTTQKVIKISKMISNLIKALKNK